MYFVITSFHVSPAGTEMPEGLIAKPGDRIFYICPFKKLSVDIFVSEGKAIPIEALRVPGG
jgi:hypothetical protein